MATVVRTAALWGIEYKDLRRIIPKDSSDAEETLDDAYKIVAGLNLERQKKCST
jgi:hypothetical protein